MIIISPAISNLLLYGLFSVNLSSPQQDLYYGHSCSGRVANVETQCNCEETPSG